MTKDAGFFKKKERTGHEGIFSLPRLLAILAVCAVASSPFIPWFEADTKGHLITFKGLATELAESGALPINVWFFPILLAVLFLLPLLTELRLTRGFYYLLQTEILIAAFVFLYPSARGLLLKVGAPMTLSSLAYGAYVLTAGLLCILLSAIVTLWQSRWGITVLAATLALTAVIVAGNLTAWFGRLTGEPRMWHQGYDARVSDGQAYGMHLTINNEGWGDFRVNLNAPEKPQEADLIISAQRHYRIGDYWADVPLERFMTEESKSVLPKEIKPGDAVVLDLVFGPLTEASSLYSLPLTGASGRYSIWLNDFSGKRSYHREFEVPPAK